MSALEFFKKFSDDGVAIKYLERKRWQNGRMCPKCGDIGNSTERKRGNGFYQCKSCRKEFSVKTGTIFESSKIGLQKWFYAIYLFQTARKGVSSLQLSKELGITQKSAWFMSHRIREAFNIRGIKLLGIVEIDETYIGGLEKNKHADKRTANNQGRSTKTKTAVVGMKQRNGKVIAKSFNNVNSTTMQQYIAVNVTQGSVLSTDEAMFYRPIKGYSKLMVNHSVSEWVNGMASTNSIESVWAVLKRGYHGTFHHFSKKHVDRYVNEFTFRLNEGNCKIDTIDRVNSVLFNTFGKRLTYKRLVS